MGTIITIAYVSGWLEKSYIIDFCYNKVQYNMMQGEIVATVDFPCHGEIWGDFVSSIQLYHSQFP